MPNDLKHIIQQNFVANNTIAARYHNAIRILLTPDFLRADCGLPSDTFNVGIPLADTPNDKSYAEMVTYFADQNKPMALWLWDFLPNWQTYLAQSPLPLVETNLGMFADMDALHITPSKPTDFSVRTVQSGEDVLAFAAVMSAVFGHSAEAEFVRRYYAMLAKTAFYHDPATRMYVGYHNEVPVSTGSIIVTQDAVGIYDIATLENVRNQGYGSAMFHHILAEIKRDYHRLAVLQASPMGAGIYRRAGFATACEVFVYENRDLLTIDADGEN